MNDESPPIIPEDADGPRAAPVVDLAGFRIRRGASPGGSYCPHRRLAYSVPERRVYCEDCKRTIAGFDAFMVLVRSFESMTRAAQAIRREADEARDAVIHLIAARKVEKAWRGKTRAICCPHCRGGILPEDWGGGGPGWLSREAELQRRQGKGGTPQ